MIHAFEEVIGQQYIKEKLIHSVQTKISHAQLFVGSAGYGTLALSVAFAQYVLCADKQGNKSCEFAHHV